MAESRYEFVELQQRRKYRENNTHEKSAKIIFAVEQQAYEQKHSSGKVQDDSWGAAGKGF